MKKLLYRCCLFSLKFIAVAYYICSSHLIFSFGDLFQVRLNGVATFIGIVGLTVAVFVLAVLLGR